MVSLVNFRVMADVRIEFQGGPLDGIHYPLPSRPGRPRHYFRVDGTPMPKGVRVWPGIRYLESVPVPKVYELYWWWGVEKRNGVAVRIYRYDKYKAILDCFKHVYGVCDKEVCRCARASLYDEFNRAPDSHLSPGRLAVKDPRMTRD